MDFETIESIIRSKNSNNWIFRENDIVVTEKDICDKEDDKVYKIEGFCELTGIYKLNVNLRFKLFFKKKIETNRCFYPYRYFYEEYDKSMYNRVYYVNEYWVVFYYNNTEVIKEIYIRHDIDNKCIIKRPGEKWTELDIAIMKLINRRLSDNYSIDEFAKYNEDFIKKHYKNGKFSA